VDTSAVLIATMQHRRSALEQALTRVGWQLAVHHDVAAALAHLRTKPYAAVFCDEHLRGASANGFLAWSRRLAPEVPFYVVATTGDAAGLGAQHRPDGVVAFPPVDADLPRPVHASMWDVPAAAARDLPLAGRTGLVRLADLIEMLALAATSSVIALGGGRVGRVYLDGGHVEHVVSVREGQETTGVRGLGRLLELEDVDFQVLPYRPPSRRTVHVPTAAALTEAARLIDEQRRDGALLDAVQAQCPEASGVAVGYAPSERPAETRGDGTVAFGLALRALDALRPLAGRVSHLAVEGEGRAIAALRFGDGHVLCAAGPRGRSVALLSALAAAIRRHGR
jgi:hypothetical protein